MIVIDAPAAAAASQAAARAGLYLQRRREAAELTIDDVATMLAVDVPAFLSPRITRAQIALTLSRIEAGQQLLDDAGLRQLRGVFAFDGYIYRHLAEDLPTPANCRGCACSWMDACDDDTHGPCAWVDAPPTLCTACHRKGLR